MLKRTITADEHSALPDDVKSHYIRRGSKYVVDLDGVDPELEVTQKQLDDARTKTVTLESEVRTLKAQATSVEERVRKEVEADKEKLTKENETLRSKTIDAERNKHIDNIASQFKTEGLIRSDLRDRVVVELVDGEVVTKFMGKDGKEVDFKTLNDEYCKNPDYSAILKTAPNTSFTPAANSSTQQSSGDNKTQPTDAQKQATLYAFNGDTAALAAHLAETVPDTK